MKRFVTQISFFILTFIALTSNQQASAQAPTLLSPHVIDSFPQLLTNINTSDGESATGMAGACPAIPCCSTYVYKVVLPVDGVLRVEMANFTPLAGSIIAYRSTVATPTSYADLTFISATPGNFCGFRDSLLLGRGTDGWDSAPFGQVPAYNGLTAVFNFNSPSPTVGFFPAGDYYILVFNENQQSSIGLGLGTDLTFEFAPACLPLTAPTSLESDTIEVGAPSDTISFYVKNDRSLDVIIDINSGVNITGPDANQFSVVTIPDSNLLVGDSSLFQVLFTPTSFGTKNASIDINFADTNCAATSSTALIGSVAEAEIRLVGNNVTINQNDTFPAINDGTDFGAVAFNSGSISKTFSIVNPGTDTLDLTGSPIVQLVSGSQFSLVSSPSSTTLLPGDTATFTIVFTPLVSGFDTADIFINNSATLGNFHFRIRGFGAELNALNFDGSNDYVNINNVANDMAGVTEFTLESWIKVPAAQAGDDRVWGVNTSSNGTRLLVTLDDGILEFHDGSNSFVMATQNLRDDVWHHVALSFDDGVLLTYIDGSLVSTKSTNVPAFAATDKWSLGQEYDSGGASDFFRGTMDDVRIWKNVRSDQEISGGRFCELANFNSNLVAYYTFNQGVADGNNAGITTLTDAVGNGLDGTLVNFALNGSTSNFVDGPTVGSNCTSFSVQICDDSTYTAPSGIVLTSSGVHTDTVTNSLGGDSALVIDLTINFTQYTQNVLADSIFSGSNTIYNGQLTTERVSTMRFEKSNSEWVGISNLEDSLVNTNRSVFVWMRAAGQVSGSQQVLVGINTSGTGTVTNFGIATNEQLWINDGGTNRNSGVTVTDTAWHFVGYTYDEGSNATQFWVDGVAAASFSNGQSISATSRISLGQEFDGSSTSNFFDGEMSEVSIWNEVLDSANVASIMQVAIDSNHSLYNNLMAYYPGNALCADGAFMVRDFSKNGFHGAASETAIINTDSLVVINGFDASNHFDVNVENGGTSVATTNPFSFSATNSGTHTGSLYRDYFRISDQFEITLPVVLSITASIAVDSNVSCNGLANGGATVTVTNGTAPFTYSWSNGATTASITGLTAGTYSVTVSDSVGTTDTASITITEPAVLIAAGLIDSNVSCNGLSDGGATASATGGTTPYTYTWNNSATTASFTGVVAGTYSLTITDANGCTDSSSVLVTEPALLVASTVQDSMASCISCFDGGATASATGGTAAYTYTWSNSATTASITGVGVGTYTVTITDANGCTDSELVVITSGPTPAIVVDSNVSCNSFIDGGATASATGGTAPYTYAWSTAATTASITGLAAGTYTVTVTDAGGLTASASTMITEPAVLVAATVVDSNTSCNGLSDGGATASATGGTSPFTYAWSTAATTASVTGLAAGTYSVTVTDNNGCTSTSSVVITEPAVLVAATVVDSNTSCNGFADGGATASATGGTMPYTYAWSNAATTASITGVAADTYTVTVTDINGCSSTSAVTITEPAVLMAATVVDSNTSCNGFADGGATTSAMGGTMPYTYTWSNSATTASITGVGAGTYTVTVTDINGCTGTSVATVTEPAVLMVSLSVDSNESCTGAANGGLTAQPAGGTMPYTYAWSTAATSASLTGAAAGTYSVTVTDANGCSTVGGGSVIILDNTPPTVITRNITVYLDLNSQASIVPAQVDSASFDACGVDSITLNVSAFDCSSVGANTVTLTVTDVNGNVASDTAVVTVLDTLSPTVQTQNITLYLDAGGQASTTAAAINNNSSDSCGVATLALDSTNFDCSEVGPNTVILTVTDVNGNSDTASAIVTVLDTLVPTVQTQAITLYLDASGQAIATAAAVDNGSADNCSIASMVLDSSSFDCSEVGANTVILTVTDASGNVSSDTATVTVLDTLAPAIQTQNTTVYLDASGQATITVGDINNGSLDNCSIATVTLDSTDFDCGEVGANTVTLTITDIYGNVASDTAVVTVLDTLSPTAQTQNTTLYLDASGQASTTAAAIDNSSFDNCGVATVALDSTNFDCSEVGANTVILTVTDVNGNSDTASATVTVLDTLAPTVQTQNITLYLNTNGQATTTAAAVDNGSFDNCGTATFALDSTNFNCSETGANTVLLTVTDVNGNTGTGTAVVTVLDTLAPILSVASDTAICATDTAGTVFTYSNSATDNCSAGGIVQVAGLSSGSTFPIGVTTNVFEVTDGSGNVTVDSFTVEVYGFPILQIAPVAVLCETGNSIPLSALPTGGVFSGAGVTGSTFDPTAVTPGNQAITYTFTTLEGCIYSAVEFVNVRENPIVDLGSFPDTICIELGIVANPVATPAGGVYSGTGVDSILFNVDSAGVGEHWITYTFEDDFGCVASDSTLANVYRCLAPLSVVENAIIAASAQVYPNPNTGTFRVRHNYQQPVSARIYGIDGALVKVIPNLGPDEEISLNRLSQGVFILHITGDQVNETKRIIVQ